MNKRLVYILLFLSGFSNLSAQSLLDELGEEEQPKEFVKNAFKSTRVISSHCWSLWVRVYSTSVSCIALVE